MVLYYLVIRMPLAWLLLERQFGAWMVFGGLFLTSHIVAAGAAVFSGEAFAVFTGKILKEISGFSSIIIQFAQ